MCDEESKVQKLQSNYKNNLNRWDNDLKIAIFLFYNITYFNWLSGLLS